MRKSLLLQIEMYKQMLREQEEEKARHVKLLQAAYNSEIQRLLDEQEAEAKQIQSAQEESQTQQKQLALRCENFEKQLHCEH